MAHEPFKPTLLADTQLPLADLDASLGDSLNLNQMSQSLLVQASGGSTSADPDDLEDEEYQKEMEKLQKL